MAIIIIVGVIMFCAFCMMLYALLCANNPHRDVDQEWEEHMRYMHELYLKQQRKKMKVRGE